MKFVKDFPIEDLEPNEWNPNEMSETKYEALKRSLKSGKKGVILALKRDGEKALIIDGYHRWKAAKELGIETFPVLLLEESETEAKLDTLRMNNIRGELNVVKLAQLIVDLEKEFSLDWLEKELGFSEGELEQIKEALELPEIEEDEIIPLEDDEIPVEIIIALDPRQHKTFEEAIQKALEFIGREKVDNVYPVVREQIPAYDRAMKEAQKLIDSANRSKALEAVCKGFLEWLKTQGQEG